MANYLLYGQRMITNDSTLADFSKSVCETLIEDYQINVDNNENFKDECMNAVRASLMDDIGRTDINYEELMYKYRFEIGELLYDIENNHGTSFNEFERINLSFFGEQAGECFNRLIYRYIDIHFDELIKLA